MDTELRQFLIPTILGVILLSQIYSGWRSMQRREYILSENRRYTGQTAFKLGLSYALGCTIVLLGIVTLYFHDNTIFERFGIPAAVLGGIIILVSSLGIFGQAEPIHKPETEFEESS